MDKVEITPTPVATDAMKPARAVSATLSAARALRAERQRHPASAVAVRQRTKLATLTPLTAAFADVQTRTSETSA